MREWLEETFGIKSWIVQNGGPFFELFRVPLTHLLDNTENLFQDWLPYPVMLALFFLLGWRLAGWRVGLFALAGMFFIGLVGHWDLAMTTLATVLTAVLVCGAGGGLLGIVAARSDRAEAVIRPILDAMQTTPSYVYLVPVVMFFGIGKVPGLIATIIFALPPMVRLTNLGIRQVPFETVEAARAFGATSLQLLLDVQLPMAMRTIMAGLNQTLMLAMAMVVVAALIGAAGLGQEVFIGLSRLRVGQAATGGVSIVILAIILDRISQGLGKPRDGGGGGQVRATLSSLRRFGAALRLAPARNGQSAEPAGASAGSVGSGKQD